jgi:ParB family chromosome partitioning protein
MIMAVKAPTQKTIDVSRIDRDPDQPRKLFTEANLDELAQSMSRNGQLQPIAVRYNKTTRRYTIVVGERRWRAAQRAGIDALQALVFSDMDDEAAFIAQIAENVNRQDMTPMEEARAYQRLTERGWEIPQVCELFGKTIEYVTWRIGLLNLVPAAQEAVEKGQLQVGLAWYVCRLNVDNQHRFLAKWARGEFKSFRDAEAFAQACRDREAQPSFFNLEEPTEEQLFELTTSRRRVITKIERLAVAGEILADLGAMEPAELARLLAGADGGVAAYRDSIEALRTAASKALSAMRKAAAVQDAAPELNADALVG